MTPYEWFIGIFSFQTYYRIIPNYKRRYSWHPLYIVQHWRWYWPFFVTIIGFKSKESCEEFLIDYQEGKTYFTHIFRD